MRENETEQYTIETLLYTDIQLSVEGMDFNVNLYFPKNDAETVSDKLIYLADGKSKVS